MKTNRHLTHDDIRRSEQSIEGWLSDHEALLLFHLAKRNRAKGDIVEIGSWKGKSTVCLGLGVQASGISRKIVAVDPHEGKIRTEARKGTSTFDEFRRNIGKAGVSKYITPIVDTSAGASRKWRAPISLLFIDGLHDYAHAKEDYSLWSPFVSDGGIIAFHDGFCGYPGVWQAIEECALSSVRVCDIGTVSSLLYIKVGTPTIWKNIIVSCKKRIVKYAISLHTKPMFSSRLNTFIVHRLLRLLLLSRPTLEVYGI